MVNLFTTGELLDGVYAEKPKAHEAEESQQTETKPISVLSLPQRNQPQKLKWLHNA